MDKTISNDRKKEIREGRLLIVSRLTVVAFLDFEIWMQLAVPPPRAPENLKIWRMLLLPSCLFHSIADSRLKTRNSRLE
jgi:hypothetical protein